MKRKIAFVTLIGALLALPSLFNSCSGMGKSEGGSAAGVTAATGSGIAAAPGSTPMPAGTIVAGNGLNVSGQGAMSVPTADAVVARITNGLQKNVDPGAGNFAKTLALVKTNLPQVSDPTAATGYDQVQLLAYGACSDLTTGNPTKMQSVYNVNPGTSITANQSALVSAGVKMLDQYVAGLASQGPTAAKISTDLTSLVSTIAAGTANTTTIAFVAVCIAANTTGTTMLGF